MQSEPAASEVIQSFAWLGVCAFGVTVFATPIAAVVARRLGVMDMPDTLLKPHARPTPYLGGAAICLGWASAVLLGTLTIPGVEWHVAVPVLIGGLAMSVLGLWDDIHNVPPRARIAIGAAILALVMITTGLGSELLFTVTRHFGFRAPDWVGAPVSVLVAIVIVLGACNSLNLIDGLDGLCAGVTAIISIGFFLIALKLAVHEYARELNAIRLVLAVAMCGAALGFLPMNFNPAKIFMGDAGSVLLGYNCGILLLLFDENAVIRWVIAGLMVFALPALDTALAIFRRWRSGRPIFEGDRSHFYDQLVDRGLSVKKVVLISYLLTAFYVALGAGGALLRMRYAVPLYALALLATLAVIHFSRMARPEATLRKPASKTGGATG